MRNALNNLLRSAGFPPKLFRSAEEFLNAEHPDSASCVVLDVRLPGMNGLELQKVLIARNVSIPIIFITAHGDNAMSLRTLEAGAVAFLNKPFLDQDLLDAIQVSLERDEARRRGHCSDFVREL